MENKQSNNQVGIYDNNYNHFLFDSVPSNSICLDIGCWTGNLGEKLIKSKSCIVDGIDTNKKALSTAKKRGYRNVYQINLNEEKKVEKFSKRHSKYDVIILGDVLEHLVKPSLTLKYIKDALFAKGIIIISVPNIAFILQRVLLVLGKFDYNPKGGIMDETHLRFFTKESIEKMATKCNYNIVNSEGYNLVKDRYFFLRFLCKFAPQLFSLQFLLILRKR